MSKKLVSEMPVMKSCCKTCPFKKVDGKYQNQELADTVVMRTLFKAQQICHHPRTYGKKETHRCRGAFEHNKTIYERLGMTGIISE